MSKRKPADEVERSFSIAELCEAENISAGTYFNLRREGLGPREIRFRSTVRITPDARREWHEKLRRHSATRAARLEQQRRIAVAKLGNAASLRTRRSALQT